MSEIYNWPVSLCHYRVGLKGNDNSRVAKSAPEGRVQAK